MQYGSSRFIPTKNSFMFSESYLGTVALFAGNFVPVGWLASDGSLLSIADNQALFAVIGTIYGGDGQTNFALPDLRGRTIVGAGDGPGLKSFPLGMKAGSETANLTAANLPAHSHSFGSLSGAPGASSQPGNQDTPTVNVAAVTSGFNSYAPLGSGAMGASTIASESASSGAGASFNIQQPYVALTWVICVAGLFPNQNNNQ
jgi:microcystin-dependent protein